MVNPLLPDAKAFCCCHVRIEPDHVTIMLSRTTAQSVCPLCGSASVRVHSRYRRTLADLPWQGSAVRWCLQARKFFCDTPTCQRRIFTERFPEVAAAYARGTVRLDAALSRIAFSCGGEGGSRLAEQLGMPTSPDTLLRRIRRAPPPDSSPLHVLGVDDWAVRRGQRYGTLLCDLQRHCPVDLLDDREAETLATWLRTHPEIQIITRDRASCYANGASAGAPQAVQVADRFHLMQNLRHALVRMLERRYREIRSVARDVAASRQPPNPDTNAGAAPACKREHRLPRSPPLREVRRTRRLERYQQVVELHRQGVSQRVIGKRLGIHRETVGRYIRAGQFPERAKRKYASKTDRFTVYLRKRWEEGCRNAAQLARELEAQGFTGSYCSVRRRLAHRRHAEPREHMTVPPPAVHPTSAGRLAWLLLTQSTDRDDQDQMFIEALFERCPEVAIAAELAQEFTAMVRERKGQGLDSWIQRAWSTATPREIRVFATGLKSDYAAVKAGLTTEWSNGQLEGQVNRLKLIKRQMYGRAKFDLLRQRVLYVG